MVESCPKDSPGQQAQTLLEAAKALVGTLAWSTHWAKANLIDAIAREEAKPATDAQVDYQAGRAAWWQIKASEANDRAQQAEASAAWWKSEGERLSAELALTRNQLTLAVERSERLSGQLAGCHYDLGEANKQRQRAEKAEANEKQLRQECADLAKQVAAERAEACRSVKAEADAKHFGDQITSLRQELTDVHGALAACLRPETQTGSARGDANVIAMVLQETVAQLLRAGYSAPLTVRQTLPLVVDELLRLRGEMTKVKAQRDDYAAAMQKVMEDDMKAALAGAKIDTRSNLQNELRSIERALCSADVLNKFASLPRDAYSCHVHNTIETAISALRDDAATPPYSPPFDGDPKACAFKPSEPKVGIVRDHVTGWTFDTMRQQFDAARTTVRVLAAELVAARQQIAGTKGFEG